MKKQIPLEKDEQVIFIKYLEILKQQGKIIEYHSNPNENILSFLDRKKTIIAQNKLKQMGAKKGVSDIYIFLPDKMIVIELKRRKKNLSKVSNEQKYWINILQKT